MKCNACDAPTRVLETRTRKEHWIERRHRCDNNHEFWTVQVLRTVADGQRIWFSVAWERAARGVAQRRGRFKTDAAIARAVRDGEKNEVIKRMFKASDHTISRIRKTLKEFP